MTWRYERQQVCSANRSAAALLFMLPNLMQTLLFVSYCNGMIGKAFVLIIVGKFYRKLEPNFSTAASKK